MADEAPSITAPGHFVPIGAISFGGLGQQVTEVTHDSPLPTTQLMNAAEAAPLEGTLAESALAGPFVPDLGRPVVLALAGEWQCSVGLMRSQDGNADVTPATLAGEALLFDQNVQEAVWMETEASARLWLDVTLADGTLSYRLSQ